MLISVFYFITFAASTVMTGSFLYKNKRIDSGYMLLCIMIILNTFGRWLVSVSENLEQAIWANKILYVGGCYAPVLLIVMLSRLCDIRVPKIVMSFLTVFASAVMLLTMTVGYSTIYYKSQSLVSGQGYKYLVKEYGPTHILYPIMLGANIAVIIILMVKAFGKRDKIAFTTVMSIGGLGFAVIISYIVSRLFHSSIEWVGVGYLAAIIVFTQLFERINMFDMTTNIASSVAQMSESGYIVFDLKKRYINANSYIKEIFPDIKSWQVEKNVEKTEDPFYSEIISWFMKNNNLKARKNIETNGKYFEISVRDITYRRKNKRVGYLLEAIDRTAEHNYTIAVEKYNEMLSEEVAAKTKHINQIKDMLVLGMASMVESRDNSTGDHIRRTSKVVSVFSEKLKEHKAELGLNSEFLDMTAKAAPMHDLGKIAIKDSILQKKGKFTDEEYAEMKRHSAEGAKIVRNILEGVEDESFVNVAENVAHYHHEKWNGTGYPDGLKGEEIPVEARIMALADVFDALVSKRCYKEAFGYDKAFGIIEESIGSHFDPVLGKLFLECRPKLEKLYDSLDTVD